MIEPIDRRDGFDLDLGPRDEDGAVVVERTDRAAADRFAACSPAIARRAVLRRGAKLAYVVPAVLDAMMASPVGAFPPDDCG